MAENSTIEWTEHTFNPWWGCQRVSPGCEHCYAETLARRYGHDVWGPGRTTARRTMSDAYWKQPLKWNKAATEHGTRVRVFCASMADVFEDHEQVVTPRLRLLDLIEQTQSLDWLLLTKRPENINRLIPRDWRAELPANVWIGTSVEDQRRADERIPHLLNVPARVRFLSCEPLLGAVDLSRWLGGGYVSIPRGGGPMMPMNTTRKDIHWVIAGGESGPGARPMHPDWARSLRDQCQAAGVAFHFKQWGEYAPVNADTPMPLGKVKAMRGLRADGTALASVDPIDQATAWAWRAGKKAAGRLLDGREWNEMPTHLAVGEELE